MSRKLILLFLIAVTAWLAVFLYESSINSQPLLMFAAEEGDVEKIKALVQKGHSINERSKHYNFGWTPLIAAVYQDQTNAIHFLVESGADVNLPGNDGETPLMWAIAAGDDNLELVKYLVKHGASIRAKDGRGASALSYANAAPPRPKILEFLKSSEKDPAAK